MTGGDASEPSTVGWAFASSMVTLPEEWARDLLRMLGHHLHAETAADLRHIRLGLIIEITLDDGRPPGRARYDEVRRARLEAGEEWPASGGLVEHYVGWVNVVWAALKLYGIGTRARVTHHLHHTKDTRDYTRFEIQEALIDTMRDIGHWPAKTEYLRWATCQRLVKPGARYPTMSPIRKNFGREGFDTAVDVAQREYAVEPDAARRQARHLRALDVLAQLAAERSLT